MRSTKNTRGIVVGMFVFIGIVILILTILTLGGQQKAFGKSIVIKAVFADVNGLQKGNNIWFSGVKIGTVKSISLSQNSQVSIEMNIEQGSKQYIHKDAKARISQEGLIGNRIVVISAGSPQQPPVEDGDIVGAEKALSPDEMMGTLQSNNKNLLEITNNIKIITKGLAEGKGTAGKLLTDESLYNEFQATLLLFKSAASNAQKISADVAAYVAKFEKKGTVISDLVTDTTIIPSLRRSAADIERVVTTANQVVNKLNETTNGVSSSLKNKNAPAGMLLNDEATAANIKVIVKNLQTATEKLNEDLEAVQHNFLLKGYFKKKTKEGDKK